MSATTMTSVFDFSAHRLSGEPVPLADYAGKVLLIVNTASKCGFTPQYAGLQGLHERFHDQGLVVMGFPCNQFGQQEPGDSQDIARFCETSFGVGFPMFQKVDVNGADAHPLFSISSRRRRACSAAKRSSGTSPSSWSVATARSSSATRRRRPPRTCSRTSSSC